MRIFEVAEKFQDLMVKYSDKWTHVEGELSHTHGVGMGGSSMPLRILEDLNVLRRHSTYYECLPFHLSDALLISYSGNTEEVLSFAEALSSFSAVTSGGKLERLGREKGRVFLLDKGFVPRAAIVEMIPLVLISYSLRSTLERWLSYSLEEEVVDGLYSYLKENLGKVFLVYGFEGFHFPAYYLKASLNENAKLPAFFSLLPEDNHNGLEGLGEETAIIVVGTPKSKRLQRRVEFLVEEFSAYYIEGESPLALAEISLKASLLMSKYLGVSAEETPRIRRLKDYLKGLKDNHH